MIQNDTERFNNNQYVGDFCYKIVSDLFPICRSITGSGVRETLAYVKKIIPNLNIFSVNSGTKVFDWEVPDEWNVTNAYIKDSFGEKIIDFKTNNLHLVGYSVPIDAELSLEELQEHLYSLPNQPDAIPYITSYYQKRWGFCLSDNQRKGLLPGKYHVVIDTKLESGILNYGEIIIPGKTNKEILLSTYICHPSMANNELSGPAVMVALIDWINSYQDRLYTYRIVFVPETIGSLTYLSKNIKAMKKNTIAGFNITCIGDDRSYSYLPSRNGNTLADKAAIHSLKYICEGFMRYTWLDRGSDERQYCSHMVDLPVASIMRTKYGEYPEYHTSLDDLTVVTPKGLFGGFQAIKTAIEIIEKNLVLETTVPGEPQLGKRGLYPTLSTKDSGNQVKAMMNMISYCDGSNSLLDIAEIIGEPALSLFEIAKPLIQNGLLIIKKTI